MLHRKNSLIPNHVAFIMDGNRRWARKNLFSLDKVYQKGFDHAVSLSKFLFKKGVKEISFWAFSVDNHKRPENEKNIIFDLILNTEATKDLLEYKIRVLGFDNNINENILQKLKDIEAQSNQNSEHIINIMFNYSWSEELIHLLQQNPEKINNIEDIKNHSISKDLSFIDLLLRTGGQKRLSNFSLLLTMYSEIYFSKKLWPDFNQQDLCDILEDYSNIQRNFGA